MLIWASKGGAEVEGATGPEVGFSEMSPGRLAYHGFQFRRQPKALSGADLDAARNQAHGQLAAD